MGEISKYLNKGTVIFEIKYNTNIGDFSTTEEVDKFIEKQKGRELRVIDLEGFKLGKYDINALFDATIKNL